MNNPTPGALTGAPPTSPNRALDGLPHLMGISLQLNQMLQPDFQLGPPVYSGDSGLSVVPSDEEPVIRSRIRRNLITALDQMYNILNDKTIWNYGH